MKQIIIFGLLSILLSSCVKLDRDPVDSYSAGTYWVSRDAVVANLAAVYQSTQMSGFFEDGNTIFIDDVTDNAYNQFSNQGPSYMALGTANASTKFSYVDLYRMYFTYTGIRNANFFLANVDRVKMDDNEKEVMKAEVRFLRAFNYARKMMFFGGVPLVTKVLDYGEELKYPRNTEAEIASFVLSELTAITDILPLTQDKGRVTKGTALALKARVELFTKDYANAEKDAKAVMDLGIYDLFQNTADIPNAYECLFWEKYQSNANRNKEAIFEICYNPPTYSSTIDAFYTSPEGGWNSVSPTQSLVDTYETANGKAITDDPTYNPDLPYVNRDPRFYASVIYPGESWNGRIFNSLQTVSGAPDEFYNSSGHPNISKTGYSMRKYCPQLKDEPSGDPSAEIDGVSFIVFRYAEVLLTYAEALIEQNKNLDLAAAAINKVRNRSNMPNVTETDQAGLRKRVRNERRVEFVFEGLRWYDMKRWNIAGTVMNGPVYGVRPGTINMTTGVVTWTSPNHITVGDSRVFDVNKDYYWPIPQEDLDNDSALKQNPGW